MHHAIDMTATSVRPDRSRRRIGGIHAVLFGCALVGCAAGSSIGLAGENALPLRPVSMPPALPDLAPVRPPEQRASTRPAPQKNIIRVRIPSPGRYNDGTAPETPDDTVSIRPATPVVETAVPSLAPPPATTPAMTAVPVSDSVSSVRAVEIGGDIVPGVMSVADMYPETAQAAGSASTAYSLRGSLAVPDIILPPGMSGAEDSEAMVPGMVTPEDLAKPALALQEFKETIERDLADLVDLDNLDSIALGTSVAEFLSGPVTPSLAPSALPARVMHADDYPGASGPGGALAGKSTSGNGSGVFGGTFLPIPPRGSGMSDISAMAPANFPAASRSASTPRAEFTPLGGISSPRPTAARPGPMAPVSLPPPLSFAQSSRAHDRSRDPSLPTEQRGGRPVGPSGAPVLPPPTRTEAVLRIPAERALSDMGGPVDAASRYALPKAPPMARRETAADARFLSELPESRAADDSSPADPTARPGRPAGKSLDMAAGIDGLKAQVMERSKKETVDKAQASAPRPDEARLYSLPDGPARSRLSSITDFQPAIAPPKAIVRDEDSDLVVVSPTAARSTAQARGKAPRRVTAKAASSASPAEDDATEASMTAGQVESVRIPPKTNIPLPPGLFDEEELAELERRGYRVERPVKKLTDEDAPSARDSGPAEKTPESSPGEKAAAKPSSTKVDTDSGPVALSPGLFRRKRPPEKAATEDVPADPEFETKEPVTGFMPVREARKLFSSILGK